MDLGCHSSHPLDTDTVSRHGLLRFTLSVRPFINFGIHACLMVLVLALLLPFVANLLYAVKTEVQMARLSALIENVLTL